MSRWTDLADWVGPTPNEDPGGMATIIGVVLHIQDGNQQGSITWCKNAQSKVSAHFFVPKIGRPMQLVDTADKAWAEAGGNAHWLSIENEGWSGQDLTPSQMEACAQLFARAAREDHVNLALTDNPATGGLGWHGMGGDAWGGHPDCPGAPVLAQRPHILSRAVQILGGSATVPPPPARTAPAFPGRTLIYTPGEAQLHGADVLEWQARMKWRGWSITVDGQYGPQSELTCLHFQEDSSSHGWPLQADGMVGPKTWAATWERPVS